MKGYSEYSDRYLRNLIPFFVISIIIHAFLITGSLAYASLTGSSDRFKVEILPSFKGNGESERLQGRPGEEQGEAQKKRIRVYRVQYFNSVLLEKPVKTEIKTDTKPIITPPKIKKPEKELEKTIIVEEPKDKPVEPIGKVYTESELTQIGGKPLFFPPYRFDVIPYNELNWIYFSSNSCKGYIIVYFLVDISKKNGFEEYFEWARFFDFLFSIEGAANPPTPFGVAEIIEDPYVLTPDVWADAIRRRLEKEEFKTTLYKKYNFIDVRGEITNGLGITELPQPQIYFVDDMGVVRMKLEGRLVDISLDQIHKALVVIKEMWGMTDIEAAFAVGAILSYQQKLAKEEKKINKK